MSFNPFKDFRQKHRRPRKFAFPHVRRHITSSQVEILEKRLQLSAATGVDDQDLDDATGDEQYDFPIPNQDESGDNHLQTCNCPICQATFTEDPQDTGEVYGGELFTGSYLPTSETFKLHSNAGAKHTIYLDFNGHTTINTLWNMFYAGGATINTAAYDFDGNTASFSTAELQRIQAIWARVAEDFLPFDVNVTTEDPGSAALIKSGAGDLNWGVRVVIGGSNSDWYGSSAGGVAFVGSFNWDTDTPTYVFENNLGNGNEKYTAEAISHEAGHTLGLSHDGRTSPSEGYYQGTSAWAPNMGVGYYSNLTQWSKGEYLNANNTEDDLSIITSSNGFGYRADDYGNSIGTASALGISGSTVNTTGIISQRTDYDFFSFTTGGGSVDLTVNANARGPNLDIRADLYDGAGNLITSSDPTNSLNATISVSLSAGTYYLKVDGVGYGDPVGTGYSDYGSLGLYTITGTLPASDPADLSLTATDAVKAEGNSGTTSYTFTVTRTGGLASATTVTYTVTGTGANAAGGGDFSGGSFPTGTVSFIAGESSKTITILVQGDGDVEADETFRVTLSNPSGSATISVATADGTIQNDDVILPAITVTPVSGLTTNESGTTVTFSVVLTTQPTANVTIVLISLNANEGVVNKTTLTFTSGNWNVAQVVTVTGVDDAAVDGNATYLIKLNAAESTDPDYNGLVASDVTVTNQDNETNSGKGRGVAGKGSGPKGGGSSGFGFEDPGEVPYFLSDIEGADEFFGGSLSSTGKMIADAYQSLLSAFQQTSFDRFGGANAGGLIFGENESSFSPLIDTYFGAPRSEDLQPPLDEGANEFGFEAGDLVFASVDSDVWN
ncbi:MAG: Calx-beta domain-containing protein [Planctomycetaceae bacterium]